MTEGSAAPSRFIIIGGAGFIGSHVADSLLEDGAIQGLTIYDNFSSGREEFIQHLADDPRLNVVKADAGDLDTLTGAMAGMDVAVHLAANPDIARAATEPAIDFDEGTVLSHNVLEAMRRSGCGRILYASGSGVYGDLGELEAKEDHGPVLPISTYGASKLASEAMISAYCHMFGLTARIFRFGNVVGPRQTHGVGLDFIKKLRQDPGRLSIQGDGNQSKSYIHVSDVVNAILLVNERCQDPLGVFNAATGDYITVREIADLAVECLGLKAGSVEYSFSGGRRGWQGDVPVVRLDCGRIQKLGWTCQNSSNEAIRLSLGALAKE